MKRVIDRPEQTFAVERAAAKNQRRILLEQRGNSGKRLNYRSVVDYVRSWRHALQAGVFLQMPTLASERNSFRSAVSMARTSTYRKVRSEDTGRHSCVIFVSPRLAWRHRPSVAPSPAWSSTGRAASHPSPRTGPP